MISKAFVTGTGRITTSGLFGLTERAAQGEIGQMLPRGGKVVDTRVGGVWAVGRLRTSVEVTPDGGRPASATVTLWALPWPQLALAAVLGALVIAFQRLNRLRRRRLAALLARARDEALKSVEG